MTADWYDDARAGGADSERFLRHFTGGDYFAWDIHRAAAYVRDHTGPGDRVQTYGMDPYVMFLAQRLSATPYIYNFELDVDAALAGSPGPQDRAWMIASARDNAETSSSACGERPPARSSRWTSSPTLFPPDADAEFASHCPEAGRVDAADTTGSPSGSGPFVCGFRSPADALR